MKNGFDNSHELPPLNNRRFIIILESLELGGAERQALLLARHLSRERGAHVQVWGFHGGPGRIAKLCEEQGIPWRIVPLLWSRNWRRRLKVLAGFTMALRRARPDVILPYTLFPNVVCGLVWRWTGARLCIWNQRDGGLGRFERKLERKAVYNTPWFVSNSQHGADFLIRTLSINPNRVNVIYNGIEVEASEQDRVKWRDKLGVKDDCFLACMIANLSMFKDHATLLRAWRRVIDRLHEIDRQAVLLLAGRFDQAHDSLKALAFDLELGSSVKFLGKVDDISGLLSAVELGIFSSRSEGCPNGVLECMAAELAVVGTDIPGIREAVGVEGQPFLVPPGDDEALANRIVELAIDTKKRLELGSVNRRRVKKNFSAHFMCSEMVNLITSNLVK